jgi:predicted amidohydrolase
VHRVGVDQLEGELAMRKKLIATPDGTTTLADELSRRGFLTGAVLGAAGAALIEPASAAMGKGSDDIDVRPDGTYTSLPLLKDSVRLGVMQTRVRPVDAANPGPMRKENLDHMLMLIENAQEWNPPCDVLFFHEFPITGFRFDWSRKDVNRLSIELPGEESEALGKAAKKYDCYIVFGSYVRDRDWPDHVLSITTIIGADGRIVDKHWKARNIMGVFATGRTPIELMTSTIYNCLDRYIEMYGADAVVPVTRTPIGNLCTSSIQREPELFRCMALKGGEIFLRTATGGFSPWDIQASAAYNRVFAAVCNNAVSPGNRFFEDAGGGGSAIYSEFGEFMARAESEHEQLVAASIPIRAYRERHRQPEYPWPMYQPVMNKYVPKYPPSKLSKYLPTDLKDAARYLRDMTNVNW